MIRIFTSPTQSIGEKGEERAVFFLKQQGFSIVDRNVANKYGEIDIVAKKTGTYHFFEVKAGNKGGTVHPSENFHPAKLRKFMISVQHYCLLHTIEDYRCQGIVVLFDKNEQTTVELIDLF